MTYWLFTWIEMDGPRPIILHALSRRIPPDTDNDERFSIDVSMTMRGQFEAYKVARDPAEVMIARCAIDSETGRVLGSW